jgi:ABC-type Fe3+-hydroxamate transport system substrate-binding protein
MWRRVVDDAGRTLSLPAPPARIVSLVPSVTELLCHLGASDRLVGVTRFCTEPATAVAGVTRIGGTKTPDCGRIVALAPDLVVVNSEENQRDDFHRLEQAGLVVLVSFPVTVKAAAGSVRRLGEAVGADAVAAALASAIEASLQGPVVQRPLRVFCPIWRRPWMGFNRDTYCHDILACSGGANLCAEAAARYPEVDLTAIAAAVPEVILLPDEPYPFTAAHFDALAPLHRTPAWEQGRVHLVDGKALSWYGSRTPAAVELFRTLLAAA